MDNNDTVTTSETSTYNEAKFQILRLHELWVLAESKARKGLLDEWRWVQDSIWRELRPDVEHLSSDDPKGTVNTNNRLIQLIDKTTNKHLKYHILNQRHEFLKILQDKCGKGAKYADNSADSWE
jgi:hypothetical protein